MIWIEVVAPYVLWDRHVQLDGHMRQLLDTVLAVARYYLRFLPGQHQEQHLQGVADKSLQYACLVQKCFGVRAKALVTHQLHMLVVHFPCHVRKWGPAAFLSELWVERLIFDLKAITSGRVMRCALCASRAPCKYALQRAPSVSAACPCHVLVVWVMLSTPSAVVQPLHCRVWLV